MARKKNEFSTEIKTSVAHIAVRNFAYSKISFLGFLELDWEYR